MMLFNTDNFYNVRLYGHLFTPNETATFVAIVDQMQAELELVPTNLANNNVSLAQNHATKAASLLSPKIWFEIAEDNPGLASDLRRAVNQLQNVSSSLIGQLKSVSELVNDLNKRLEENAMVRIGQVKPGSSNILEALKSLGSIFDGNNKEEPDQNIELQALDFADVINAVLINYGNAYCVGFDMTNMSNMEMIGSNGSGSSMVTSNPASGNNSRTGNINMSMHSVNTSSSSMTQHGSEMKGGYSLVDVADYQSAQALATKALQFYNSELADKEDEYNTVFITKLESGLTHLIDSIANKDSPLDVMMIARVLD